MMCVGVCAMTVLAFPVVLLAVCVGSVFSQVSQNDRTQLLNLHNQFRQKVASGGVGNQPPTPNLGNLKWSSDLEESAQAQASSCVFSHNSADQRKTAEWAWVGQNLALASSLTAGFSMWTEEASDYNYGSNSCSRVCGHYTQVVWAETTHVGCGVQECPSFGWNAIYLVCNYGPGGNMNNARPYSQQESSQDSQPTKPICQCA